MFCDFNNEFHPTPEQKHKDTERFNRIIKQAYAKKECATCKFFIPFPDSMPGFVVGFPCCKISGGPAINTCDKYECDGMMEQRLINECDEE